MTHAARRDATTKINRTIIASNSLPKRVLAVLLLLTIIGSSALAEDRADVATSALEFGGSLGKLLWISVADKPTVTIADGDRYGQLAARIKGEIDSGRASSSLIKANFDVVGSTLIYSATVDPEPLSKTVAGIGAWAAKKTGDAVGQMVTDKAEEQARGILAEGLKNSGLSDSELKNMSSDQLRSKVDDFQIGGQKLRDILHDDPQSLDMLRAAAQDLAITLGVEGLARSAGIVENVSAVKQTLADVKQNIKDFQTEAQAHLERIEGDISSLQDAATISSQKLDQLTRQVQGDSKAIQTIAQISYSGWTTSQKLQAVSSGMFPDLTTDQTKALVQSLQADLKREETVGQLQNAAHDFGNLASIAQNIGLPSNVVTGLQGAQTLANGIAHFATGDILGGLANVTSLVGLGGPDAAAKRYAAMMNYLNQQFTQVNKKLDEVIDLQQKTLQIVIALADEQRQFREEVLSQLDRIEDAVLKNEQLLQAILLGQWTNCYAFISGSKLNGQFLIPNQKVLVALVEDAATRAYAEGCYSTMGAFLDAWVKPGSWSGQIIDADKFPTDAIAPDQATQKGWANFMSQQNAAYTAARDFVIQLINDDSTKKSAEYLARFAQPVADSYYNDKLDAAFADSTVQARFAKFKCTDSDILSAPLRDLLCYGRIEGDPSAPVPNRITSLLTQAPIGPQAFRLVRTGIPLSTIIDFSRRGSNGRLIFVKPQTIENFSSTSATAEVTTGLAEHKGENLLRKLQWLTEANVLQQSVTYGSQTAVFIEHQLYDPVTKSLSVDSISTMTPLKQKALQAMRMNPILARNVVLLAMRHAIADELGGQSAADSVQYLQTYYTLALNDFRGSQACNGSALARQKLSELFPNWKFDYWITSDQKQKEPDLSSCKLELASTFAGDAPRPPQPGVGTGVVLSDFYVLLPSPLALSTGLFEQSDNLKLALAYRDRLNQTLVDRNIGTLVRAQASATENPQDIDKSDAFALLNEGWGWVVRKK